MLRCKHVADALAQAHHWDLPWYRRWGLHLHVALCFVCGRYHRQVILMQDALRVFRRREDADQLRPEVRLSPEARRRIAASWATRNPHERTS